VLVRTPVKDISVVGRNTQGVRLIRLEENDQLSGLERIDGIPDDPVILPDGAAANDPQAATVADHSPDGPQAGAVADPSSGAAADDAQDATVADRSPDGPQDGAAADPSPGAAADDPTEP